MRRLIARILQRAQQLQARQHPDDAVELAARRLGIQMTADGDGWQAVIAPRATGEDIAHVVDGDRATGLFAGSDEPAAHLGVEFRERQPLDAALGRAADPGGVENSIPQPRGVDGKIGVGTHTEAFVSSAEGCTRSGLFGCSFQVEKGSPVSAGFMVMQLSTGQTWKHRLQPTHSSSITA